MRAASRISLPASVRATFTARRRSSAAACARSSSVVSSSSTRPYASAPLFCITHPWCPQKSVPSLRARRHCPITRRRCLSHTRALQRPAATSCGLATYRVALVSSTSVLRMKRRSVPCRRCASSCSASCFSRSSAVVARITPSYFSRNARLPSRPPFPTRIHSSTHSIRPPHLALSTPPASPKILLTVCRTLPSLGSFLCLGTASSFVSTRVPHTSGEGSPESTSEDNGTPPSLGSPPCLGPASSSVSTGVPHTSEEGIAESTPEQNALSTA